MKKVLIYVLLAFSLGLFQHCYDGLFKDLVSGPVSHLSCFDFKSHSILVWSTLEPQLILAQPFFTSIFCLPQNWTTFCYTLLTARAVFSFVETPKPNNGQKCTKTTSTHFFTMVAFKFCLNRACPDPGCLI